MSTNKNGKKKWKIALALLAASLISIACFGIFVYVALYKILPFFLPTDYIDEAYTYGDHIETGYVGFEAGTIIEALDQYTANPFFPLASTPKPPVERLPSGSFPWKQADYMAIGDKLFEFVWHEPSNSWLFHSMDFTIQKCSDTLSGFDRGRITYFSPTSTNGKEQYTARDFLIDPLAGYAIWGRTWNYPRSFEWRNIDLNNVKITAEEALKIAESHGGLEIRSKVTNNCMITLKLSPYYSRSSGSGWDVIYLGSGYRIFYIFIDSNTGEYRVINIDE